MNKYAELSWSFFKIGLFTFGGGLAMLPIIEREMIEKKKWLNEDEMTDIIAIAESTPGVIAVNSATFIGYKVGKFWGALLATLSVVLPSFIIILIISLFIEQFLSLEYVKYAFMGIRCCVALLILKAALKLFKKLKKNCLSYILILCSIAIMLILPNLSVIYILLFGALVGLIERMITIQKKKSQIKTTEMEKEMVKKEEEDDDC